jgi:CBS domain-containing protein
MAEKRIEQVLKDKKILEIVSTKLVQAGPDVTVEKAIALMNKKKSGYVVIAKGKQVLGVFTETNLVQKILEQDVSWKSLAKEHMTTEVKVLTMQDSVGTAIDLMGRFNMYYIPLVDEKKSLVNVLSVRTLIRFLAAFYPAEVYNLPPRPDQISTSPEGG